MKAERGILLLLCGFAALFVFAWFLLVPQVLGVRASQVELRILETRARIAPYVDIPYDGSGEHLFILCKDELFVSLAYVRRAAHEHGLDVVSFVASDVDNFGLDVSEMAVRAMLSGSFGNAIDYVHYLAVGVYNIRYLSLINAEEASFDVWFSIFYED